MKKNVSKLLVTALSLSMVLSMAACSSTSSSPSSSSSPSGGSSAAESTAPESSPTDTGEIREYSIGSSHSSGTYYQWCVAVSNVVNKYAEGFTLTPITTVGAVEGVQLMQAGEIEFGGGSGITEYSAYNGIGEWEGQEPYTDLRIISSTYPDFFHIVVAADSDINSFEDLYGKTIACGVQGNGAYTATKLYFEALGLTEDKYTPAYLNTGDGASALMEGTVDVLITIAGAGSSALLEVAASSKGMKLVPLTDEQINTIHEAVPIATEKIMPAGTYEGVDYDVKSVGSATAWCADASVSEDDVYQIAKIMEEHHDELVSAIGVAEYTTAENTYHDWADAVPPIHPGALRYFEELGLTN